MPEAIEQLGAKLTLIDQDELAGGDLSKYDVIVTGVRAYERRAVPQDRAKISALDVWNLKSSWK